METTKKLKILAIGAHPDDCDLRAGGTAALYTELGHSVTFFSLTNGDTGHQSMGGGELARRRYSEASEAAAIAGANYICLDIHCGELMPTLENRRSIIRVIREIGPDLIMTHRPNDYHPDHRYGSQLVMDSVYVCTVPGNTALTPHIMHFPVVVYFTDEITEPTPFVADIAIDIQSKWDTKVRMLDCHESQMYEWLPYNRGNLDQVPSDKAARIEWLARQEQIKNERVANDSREVLRKLYGEQRGNSIRLAESFRIGGYGALLPPEQYDVFFPMLKSK